jgi:hypothetical protein
VQAKLPKKDLPVYIDDTGYIRLNGPVYERNRWCYDKVGRIIVAFEDEIMFMRGLGRPIVMGGNLNKSWKSLTLSDQFYGKKLDRLIEDLEEFPTINDVELELKTEKENENENEDNNEESFGPDQITATFCTVV